MTRLDWDKARRQQVVRNRGAYNAKNEWTRKPRGISNKQATYLASLQKQLGLPYSGAGMTAKQAHSEIDQLKRRLEGGGSTRA